MLQLTCRRPNTSVCGVASCYFWRVKLPGKCKMNSAPAMRNSIKYYCCYFCCITISSILFVMFRHIYCILSHFGAKFLLKTICINVNVEAGRLKLQCLSPWLHRPSWGCGSLWAHRGGRDVRTHPSGEASLCPPRRQHHGWLQGAQLCRAAVGPQDLVCNSGYR